MSKTYNALTTYYIKDAQGNSLAVYDNASGTSNWREQQLYGSSRLGMWKPDINLATTSGSARWSYAGLRFFELNNHLGNVNVVINDVRTLESSVYKPTIINANDYFAFGGQMKDRSFTNAGSMAYRYGFNGKENDNEVKGEGNQQDYGMRIYDPRIGKFLSVDPITAKYPFLTPYQFASNRVFDGVDQDGLEFSDFMRNFINNSKLKLKNYIVDEAKKASYKIMGSVINYFKDNVEIKYYAKIEAKYTVGGRASSETMSKNFGVDVNLGSVDLVSVSVEYDYAKKQFDGTLNYLNKDGKIVFSQGISGNVTIPIEGYPAGVGGGFNREVVKDTKSKRIYTSKKSANAGVGIAPVNITANMGKENNNTDGSSAIGSELAAGIGGAIGVGIVVEYKVEVLTVKATIKN